jgi:mono/diheme cytochrome c family protein
MREHLARWAVLVTAIVVVGLAFLAASIRSGNAGPERTDAPAVAPPSALSPGVVPPSAAPPSAAPPPAQSPTAPVVPTADRIARGRSVFVEQRCAQCHSIAGVGSPRYPLDGVGARRTPASIRAWTVALPAVEDSLPPGIFRRKRSYQQLPATDLDALVAYLSSLTTGRR